MGFVNVIKVAIIGDAKGLNKLEQGAAKSSKKIGGSFKGISSGLKGALGGVGIATGVAFLGKATQSAIAGEQANALLAQALTKAAHATKAQVDQTKSYITKTALATGITKGELRPALINLVNATHNVGKSQKLMNLALDVSARTGKPLAQVTAALAKGYNGNVGALGRLGVKVKSFTKDNSALLKAQGKVKIATLQYAAAVKLHGKGSEQAKSAALKLLAAQDALHKTTVKNKSETLSFDAVTKQLAKSMGGASATAANTTAGKMARLKVRFAAAQAEIGAKLLPILNKLADVFLNNSGIITKVIAVVAGLAIFTKVATWAKSAWSAMKGLGKAIQTVGKGLGSVVKGGIKTANALKSVALKAFDVGKSAASAALNIAKQTAVMIAQKTAAAAAAVGTKLMAAAQWALNAALNANPITLVIAAIVAIGVALFVAYKKVKWFHTAVDGAWQILQTLFHWVVGHWPLLLGILTGPIGLAVLFIVRHFGAIREGAANAFHAVVGFFTSIPGRIGGLAGKFLSAAVNLGSSLLHGLLHGLGSAAGAAGNFIADVARGIKDLINNDIIDPIRNIHIKWKGFHGIGKFDIHPFGFLPRLHEGGVFNSGRGEGVALLRDGEGVFTPAQMRALGLRSGPGGGATIVNIHHAASPAETRRQLRKWQRRNRDQ